MKAFVLRTDEIVYGENGKATIWFDKLIAKVRQDQINAQLEKVGMAKRVWVVEVDVPTDFIEASVPDYMARAAVGLPKTKIDEELGL